MIWSKARRWGVMGACLLLGCLAPVSGAEKVQVRIEGLRSVTQKQAEEWMASQLEFVKSAGVTMARADDLSYFLENALRERGYKKATVDWEIPEEGQTIVLKVSEGDSARLGEIHVMGNEHLEKAAVVELLTSATMTRLKLDEGDPIPFVAADLEQGKGLLVDFYHQMGFARVQVDLAQEEQGGRTDVRVEVAEGPLHRTGEIHFPEAPAEVVREEYEAIRQEFAGGIYSGAVSGSLRTRLRAAALKSGYYKAEITVEAGEPLTEEVGGEAVASVPLHVHAEWGDTVEVAKVRVEGNEKVKPEFFERHFDGLQGEHYSPQKTNEIVNELLRTGAFETIRTDLVQQPDGTYELGIEVEEAHSRTLGIYGGYATYEGQLVGFEFRNLNVFGMVRQMDAAIEYSKRGMRGEISYTDPWFLSSDFEFKAAIFAVNRVEKGYEKFQTGGRYEWTRKFGMRKRNSVSLFGEASYTDVHKWDVDPVFLRDRHYFAHQVGLSLAHDRRDRPNAPRSGFLAQTSVSVASDVLGSEVDFLKATGRLGYYLPVGEHTLRLSARAGYISSLSGGGTVPIDLRFYNGGAQSVRSFRERNLGPKDRNGHPVGGELYTIFNVEYEIPISTIPGLSLVPFADAGNLFYDAADAEFPSLRYALGLGIRYQTPIGPLRVEYGYNPDREPGEDQGAFHIGFGFTF